LTSLALSTAAPPPSARWKGRQGARGSSRSLARCVPAPDRVVGLVSSLESAGLRVVTVWLQARAPGGAISRGSAANWRYDWGVPGAAKGVGRGAWGVGRRAPSTPRVATTG